MNQENYYDKIADGYDELYETEQDKKCALIKKETPWKITGKILDVGCGSGISSEHFEADVCIDPSEKLLALADKKNNKRLHIIGKAEKIYFNDDEFDFVISITAIQNFEDIEKGLAEIKRVGRRFILTFLKKSEKKSTIEKIIRKMFTIVKEIEEEKDIIFFCEK